MHACLMRPEENVRLPGVGVRGSCEPPAVTAETKHGSSGKAGQAFYSSPPWFRHSFSLCSPDCLNFTTFLLWIPEYQNYRCEPHTQLLWDKLSSEDQACCRQKEATLQEGKVLDALKIYNVGFADTAVPVAACRSPGQSHMAADGEPWAALLQAMR